MLTLGRVNDRQILGAVSPALLRLLAATSRGVFLYASQESVFLRQHRPGNNGRAHNPTITIVSRSLMSIQSINARNQFKGKIKEIIEGPVVSEVDVETPFGIVTSVITSRSVRELQLQPGVEVLALVKATEVSIAKL